MNKGLAAQRNGISSFLGFSSEGLLHLASQKFYLDKLLAEIGEGLPSECALFRDFLDAVIDHTAFLYAMDTKIGRAIYPNFGAGQGGRLDTTKSELDYARFLLERATRLHKEAKEMEGDF